VKLLNEYEIPFHGLKEGIHNFDFDVSDRFFEYFDNPDYFGGSLKVKVVLFREPQLLTLNFSIAGHVCVICDRCLEEYKCPVTSDESIFMRFGEIYEELDNNIISIPRNEKRINVAQFIYELAVLNLPIKRIHPVDKDGNSECNPEMLKKIAEYNKTDKKQNDPRWDILREVF
jgi:uncharacterized metal-binding protein YceD (DUF177 family)